ncbi:MAG TPA: isoamylase early set domain-containing protein [Streptosporangiaceae bacterium]|nr:isoamylase early set domain-containing protein [Streptosporangiaceae bacterium]
MVTTVRRGSAVRLRLTGIRADWDVMRAATVTGAPGELTAPVVEGSFAGLRLPPGDDITVGSDTPGPFTSNMNDDAHNWGQSPNQGGWPPEWREQLIKTTKAGRNGTVRVTFALPADEPRGAVSVVGDFNDWDPFAHPLRRRANGTRSAAVNVRAGSVLRFRYLAEGGVWFDDEAAPAWDSQGSSIAV